MQCKYKIFTILLIIFFSHTIDSYGVGDNWTHYNNGLRFLKQGKYPEALGNFNYYLKQPEMHRHMFGVAYFGRGLYYQTLENYAQSLNEYRMAIKNDLHPTVKISFQTYMNMGVIYIKMKTYQDAISAYSKAVEIKPENGLAHYYLGLAYLKINDYERAKKESVEAKRLGVEFTALSNKLAEKGVLKEGDTNAQTQSDK